jgi:hypothetical protein
MSKKIKFVSINLLITISLLVVFQNCSEVSFSNLDEQQLQSSSFAVVEPNVVNVPEVIDEPEVVCNPLASQNECDNYVPGQGLIGNLYYLEGSQASLFGGSLSNADLDDYRVFGTKLPEQILMTSVNVTPRSWDSGFYLSEGNQVKTLNGEALFEFFHIDLSGSISLPTGDYQLATVSDDGVRLTLDGQVYISNPDTHGVQWDCSSKITFSANAPAKDIRLEYFQGPRYKIALQLLVRPWSQSNLSCNSSGGFSEIEPAAYSH